jgi:2-polyprenyl-3-methyl-5-hydroxy-6-metoxy-1,4-benzoquinol methylase
VTPHLEQIIRAIERRNPIHAKKLALHLAVVDASFENEFNVLLDRYLSLLKPEGGDLNFVIDCYLKMLDDIVAERVEFLRTGRYSSSSFDEVNMRVYGNPGVMAYYMHGLFLSQFLWHQHHKIYSYFLETIRAYAPRAKAYLEVGGGHGLYLRAFCGLSRPDAEITVVDISPTSLGICREMAAISSVRYIEADIHSFSGSESGYDFITIGEVLEHVEDPVRLLRKLRDLCSGNGVVFMTTPTNAPAIDHIYLFRDVQHIRTLIAEAGLEVLDERAVLTEDATPKRAAAAKIATLYGALLAPVRK